MTTGWRWGTPASATGRSSLLCAGVPCGPGAQRIPGLALILVRIYGAHGAAVAVLCPQSFIAAGQALALWRSPAPARSRA